MLLGVREYFAVECFDEPDYLNEHGWVFGRMYIWCRGIALGDPNDPACLLNVTEGFIEDCLAQIDDLPDESAYDLLEAAIYGGVACPSSQITADSIRSRKFNYFTCWGESFERSRGFLIEVDEGFRVLYSERTGFTGSTRVGRAGLVNALRAFLDWMTAEKANVPTP